MITSSGQSDNMENSFIRVLPAGCYHAVEGREPTVARGLLHRILGNAVTPAFSDYPAIIQKNIIALNTSGFISFDNAQTRLPDGNLSDLLPQVLPALSERKRVVLTEARQGLFLDFTGVSQEQAEELAVLAASLRSLSDTRTELLTNQLSITSRAFGIVDPSGNSEIGFWPLHIAENVLTLIVLGIPRFNSVEFCTLVWALIERYGSEDHA